MQRIFVLWKLKSEQKRPVSSFITAQLGKVCMYVIDCATMYQHTMELPCNVNFMLLAFTTEDLIDLWQEKFPSQIKNQLKTRPGLR